MVLSIPLISHLIAALTILFLGIIVYFHDKKSITNTVLFLHTLVIAFWTISNYFSIAASTDQALFWIRLVIFFAVPHVFLFFFFVYTFPEKQVNIKLLPAIVYLVFIFGASFIALSPYGFKGIRLVNNSVTPEPGSLMPLFGLIIVSLSLWTFILLIKKYKEANEFRKIQYRSIFIGLAISYLLLISLVFLAVNIFGVTYFVQFSPFFIIPMILGSVYAILRHNLLNIKVIATEILTYAILVILLSQVLLSKSLGDGFVRIITLVMFLPSGIFLIRSVLKEVEQREQLQILTEELSAKNVKLEELDQLKSEFLSFASHQVKSPMAVIKGFAQLIYDGTYGQLPDEAKEKAKKIKESADRTLALVNNLLDLRKIEEGKMEFKFEDVDIVKLISDMVQEYKVIGDKKGLAMGFESSAASIKIKADQEKVRQVIQNLLDNSVKYTDKGYIKASVKDEGDKVLIAVTDSGRGMSPELLKKLFGRFVRDEQTAKEVQGTGLGLYIAKQIVTEHKGQIWVESDGEGLGSRFYVRLSKV